jgi:CHAD domain-containing protein
MKRFRDLAAEDSVSQAARVSLRERLTAVRRELKKLARDADRGQIQPERIHQVRVATRRAAAALDLYRPFVPGRPRKWWRKHLRRWRRAGGEPRNCDLLLAAVGPRIVDSELAAICLAAETRRASGCLQLGQLASQARRAGLKKRIRQLVRAIGQKKTASGKRELGDWSRKRLRKVVAQLLESPPDARSDSAALHQFRLRAKRLRYTLELLGATLPQEERAQADALVTRLQDHLGRLNDQVTLSGLLTRMFPLQPDSLSPMSGALLISPAVGAGAPTPVPPTGSGEDPVIRRARELRDAFHRDWEGARQRFLAWWNDEGQTLCRLLGRLSAVECPEPGPVSVAGKERKPSSLVPRE